MMATPTVWPSTCNDCERRAVFADNRKLFVAQRAFGKSEQAHAPGAVAELAPGLSQHRLQLCRTLHAKCKERQASGVGYINGECRSVAYAAHWPLNDRILYSMR